MKRYLAGIIGLAVLTTPAVGLAGIAGSDHDLSGTSQKVCFACHIPHNALGAKLWAQAVDPSGLTPVADLCYTCHDGTVTTVGEMVFNGALENHKNITGADCSAPDGACHNVHEQNPNLSGKFLNALVTGETNGSYCETCHDDTPLLGATYGDHTAGIEHFTNGTTFTCNQCHSVHGATPQTANTSGLTHPVLLADNEPGGYWGAFCVSCHAGTPPAVASSDVFDYAEATNDGTEWKHPTTSTTGGFPVGGCNKCHIVHDPAGAATNNYILMADNTDSGYCVSCHDGTSGPQVGANTHFTGQPSNANMNGGLVPALPWANEIDEDGVVGADYASATAGEMVCQTCHSVHRQGYQTTPAYLLRDDNSNNEICSACHTTN